MMKKKGIRRALAVFVAAIALIALAATPAQAATYFNCPAGTGCMWSNKDGGGTRTIVAFGTYGSDRCYTMYGTSFDNVASSASADYGNGWDLVIYAADHCAWGVFARLDIHTSSFVNFTGALSYFNDSATSFMITHVL